MNNKEDSLKKIRENKKFQKIEEELSKEKLVLSTLIKRNPEKIDGFSYENYRNSSQNPHRTFNQVHLISNGNFLIEEKVFSEDSDFEKSNQKKEEFLLKMNLPFYRRLKIGYSPENIAEELLNPNERGWQLFGDSSHFSFNVKSRNNFYRKIKEYTGWDIKLEKRRFKFL